MLTKTLLALSLIAGGAVAITTYNPTEIKLTNNPIQNVTQLSTADVSTIASDITVRVYVGKDKGSGILIAKDNNTYTVITNAHVTDRGEAYTIKTPDGMQHEAILAPNNTENDLAILQFNSNNDYQIATIGNSDGISEGETVIAAGFPETQNKLLVTEGEISLITEKPLNKGYAIGFSNETVQGMSGGALLNSSGEVIAVLGRGMAILDTAYDYIDGTTPNRDEIAAFREVSFSIPIANIATLSPDLASLVPSETETETEIARSEYIGIVARVDNIAEQITVRIATPKLDSHGSGVIIARNDNTYYVATAGHVVDPNGEYRIVTPDGETHSLDNATINKSSAYDLAIFSFISEKDYTVATIGNYSIGANEDRVVFVSGFPNIKENISPMRIITGGKVTKKEETSFKTKDFYSLKDNGRGLLYTNLSYGGMSGGAVLDSEGSLVGINTGAENELYIDAESNYNEIALGYSLGETIANFLGFLTTETQFNTKWLEQTDRPAVAVSESDYANIEAQLLKVEEPKDADLAAWMNYGNQLWRYEKYSEAIDAFNRVIEIEPDFDRAYYGIGLAYWGQDAYQQAIATFKKATQINPNSYFYWRYLGYSHGELKQYEEAFAAYEKAIALGQDFVLYTEYGTFLTQAQQYDRAITSYDEALNLNPNHPWIYNNRGLAYSDLQQYDLALADFERAIELNPQSANPYNNRGNIYYQLKQYQKALDSYHQAITIEPSAIEAYNNRGLVYQDLGQYNKALANYDRAIALAPQDTDSHTNRGNTYRLLEQYDRALAEQKRAIELDPQYALAYNNRALVYYDLEQYDSALADFERAIAIEPQSPLIYSNRGGTYKELKQYDLALADFNKALELDPNYTDAYYNRAGVYLELQQYDLALVDLNKAVELNPESDRAYYTRGNVYVQLQKYEEAIADYTQSIALDPEFPDVYFNRAILYYGLQQYDNSVADLTKAIALDPNSTDAYYNHGTAYNSIEQYDKGISDLSKAISLNPEYTNAYVNRGFSYRQLEQYDLAIEDWTKAIALDPQNADAYFKRGGLYQDLKQNDKAIADLVQTTKLNPQNAQAYVGLGLIYYELQDIPKTRENWEQAAALFEEQGQTELYQNLQGLLQQL